MQRQAENASVPFARQPVRGRQPERRTLALADGHQTGVYVHAPAGQPRALPVVYFHGIQSHPGWFVGSASHLADKGWRVFQVTRRGSGENSRQRGHAASARQLLDDVDTACRFAMSASGANRVHLLGVSWGGKLLAAYASQPSQPEHVASLTMVAPGIATRVDISVWKKMAIGLALLFAPRKKFEIPLSDVELFTDNEEMQSYLRQDRFRLLRATSRFLYASRCLDRILCRRQAGSLKMPTTLILASRDRIINNAATRKAVERLTAAEVFVEKLDGCHTLEFEPDPQSFYAALISAIERAEQDD